MDFSDESAYREMREDLVEAADAEGWPPFVTFLDDPDLDGRSVEAILKVLPEDYRHPVIFIADAMTMDHPERPLLVVDVSYSEVHGREFRAVPAQVPAISANMSIANMWFAEFADAVDCDGIFREFR